MTRILLIRDAVRNGCDELRVVLVEVLPGRCTRHSDHEILFQIDPQRAGRRGSMTDRSLAQPVSRQS